jgi:nicotinamidase-related amidase
MEVAAAQGSLWATAYAPAHEELHPYPDDFVIMKPRFSAFYGTNLDGILNAFGTETL